MLPIGIPAAASLLFANPFTWFLDFEYRVCKGIVHRCLISRLRSKRPGERMEHSLSFATWFWLIVPMCAVLVLSFITYLLGK